MLVFPEVEISTNRNGGKSNEQLLTKNSGLEQLLLYHVLVCFKGNIYAYLLCILLAIITQYRVSVFSYCQTPIPSHKWYYALMHAIHL